MDDTLRSATHRNALFEAKYLRNRAAELGRLAKAIAEAGNHRVASKLLTVVVTLEATAAEIERRTEPRLPS